MKKQHLFFVILCLCIVSILTSCKKNNDVTIEEVYTFYGTVSEAATGSPVEGASVWIEQAFGPNDGTQLMKIITGYDGSFEMSLKLDPNGEYYIYACKNDIGCDYCVFKGLGANYTRHIDFSLHPEQ